MLSNQIHQPLTAGQQMTCLSLLKTMLALPTAPFVEGYVLAFVRQFAAARKLHCHTDSVGNLLLSKGRTLPKQPVVFVAHCDHPGFVARQMLDPTRLLADWHGGVEPDYFVNSRVRFHDSLDSSTVGTVREIVGMDNDGSRHRVHQVVIDINRPVPAGSPGTWDVTPFSLKGRTIHGARIDDIAGLAAALAAMDLLIGQNTRNRAAILVTRAEEAGLVGASAAAFAKLLPMDAAVVSIECSQWQVDSRQQEGAIVRVGDRTSLFDPDLGDWLSGIASQIAQSDPTFLWQRKLMPGGTCEASVFRAAGYHAAGLCTPLGNYHNRDMKRKKIRAETIDREDWLGLVRLIAAAATYSPKAASTKQLAESFKKRLDRFKPLLKNPLAEPA